MTPPKRHQTQTERDLSGLAAKHKREADREVVPEYVEQDDDYTGKFLTGQISRDDLVAERRKRPDSKRLEKLEAKNDVLVAELLASNKWRRDVMLKIIAGIIALGLAYMAGRHG